MELNLRLSYISSRLSQCYIFTFTLNYLALPDTLLHSVFSRTLCERDLEQRINKAAHIELIANAALTNDALRRLELIHGLEYCVCAVQLGLDCVLWERTGAIDERNMKNVRSRTRKTSIRDVCGRASSRFVKFDSFVRGRRVGSCC